MASHKIDISEATNTVETIDLKIKEMDTCLDHLNIYLDRYIEQSWISEAATACKNALESKVLSARGYFTNIQVYLDDLRKKIDQSSELEDNNYRIMNN